MPVVNSLFRWLASLLSEPRVAGINVDSGELIKIHRKILKEKKILQEVFFEFYDFSIELSQTHLQGQGQEVELGAGSSLFKSRHSHIASTDIKLSEGLDQVVDAQKMPFTNSSVRCFYCINCFHHFPNPEEFFNELNRTLEVQGGAILIEPYFGPWASLFYKHIFKTEGFNKKQESWKSEEENHGAMIGANQALSYIIFFRDRDLFLRKYPNFEVVFHKPLTNYVRYLLSGGLNFKSLMPATANPILKFIEWLLKPLAPLLALHHVIVIRKVRDASPS